MVTLYTSPSCSSCRKAKKFLTKNEVQYKEKNIFVTEFKEEELKKIIRLTENGISDIISTRSKYLQDKKIDINKLKISEIINIIKAEPSVLKRPLIVQLEKDRLQIGYNSDEIELFLRGNRRLDFIDEVSKSAKTEVELINVSKNMNSKLSTKDIIKMKKTNKKTK